MKFRNYSPDKPVAVLVTFLTGPDDDPKFKASLPGWAILGTHEAPKGLSSTELLAPVRKLTNVTCETPVYLAGFSAGCQSVRHLVLGGFPWAGVGCFDGTHAELPEPKPFQIDVWKGVVDKARAGEMKAIFTCTQMGYVENKAPGHVPYMSTLHVLERVLDTKLYPNTPIVDGQLYVECFPSQNIDAPAHIRQQNEVMPLLLKRWAAKPCVEYTEPVPEAVPLRKRLAMWALTELRHEVKEDPLGSNDGPRLREYDKTPFMRKGKRINVPKTAWCVKAIGAGLFEVKGTDVIPPLRVSGIEMVEDAKKAETWIPADMIPKGSDCIGFVAIYNRDNPAKKGDEWARHGCVVVDGVHEDGSFQTAGGNELDRWRLTSRHVDDRLRKDGTELLGLIRV